MARALIPLALLVRSHAPATRWGTRVVAPFTVLTEPPEGATPGRPAGSPYDADTSYAGEVVLELHSGETAHYRDNLGTGRPMLWAALKRGGAEIFALTADPYEGEALAGDDGLLVEALPMPGSVAEALTDFVARHHVERAFEKRRRAPADPEALARRGPGRAG